MLQDTDLLRFVFDRDPNGVRGRLKDFAAEMEQLLSHRPQRLAAAQQHLELRMHETEFYSKVDGSIDFGRTR